jgi:ribosomal protein L7/L12
MANELVPFDYSRKIANGMDYRFYMEKALTQDNTRAIANAIRDNADRQIQANAAIGAAQVAAINNQTNAMAEMFGSVNNTLNAGFDSVNNTLNAGFDRMEYQLGELGASFTAGAASIIDATFKMSEAICDKLDVLADIANNPRRTEAREFYRDGARNYLKGLYEESRDFLKQALEKDKTDYRSWYLLGIIYLRGKGEYSDVINIDDAISALTNTAKYISPEIAEYNNANNRNIVIKSYDPSRKVALIKEVKTITGMELKETKELVESVESRKVTIATDVSAETYHKINRQLTACGASLEPYNDIPSPKPLAAEILFYLGQAKRFKSNELEAAGKPNEAGTFLLEARKDYEKSWAYSDKMLEARYNAARCKALLGDTEGALSDLDELFKKDKAYSVKVEIDSDFDVIREAYYQRRAEEEQRIAEERRRLEEEQHKRTEERRREKEEHRKVEEEQRRRAEERRRLEEEQRRRAEAEKREAEEKKQKQQQEWKSKGLCIHCGGKLGGLLTKKCKSCGR